MSIEMHSTELSNLRDLHGTDKTKNSEIVRVKNSFKNLFLENWKNNYLS